MVRCSSRHGRGCPRRTAAAVWTHRRTTVGGVMPVCRTLNRGMAEELARAAEGAQERRRPCWPDGMVSLLCSSCGSLVLCPMFLPAAGSSICDSTNGDDGIFFFLSLFITFTAPSLFAIRRLLDQFWTTTHGRLLMGDWDEVSTTSVLIGSSAGQHRDSNGLLTAVDVNWTL